ncbi:MAG: dihydrodipicolinate synthase family protein [Cyanobacteria bacterium HKST-UBA03]|nr:dihydrodipicolinate synthase family protein [Cyanobacteria bacterium HKST-UBA03]
MGSCQSHDHHHDHHQHACAVPPQLQLAYYVAVLTLVDADVKPIIPLIKAHLSALQCNGVQGVLVLGTNGEFPHLNVRQRQQYLEVVVGQNMQLKTPLRMMAHIGASNLADTLALQAHALEQPGVQELLLMPPFYYPATELNGLADYVNTVLDRQPDDVPLFIYHFPKLSGVPITPDLLRACPRLKGIKDSSGDVTHVRQLRDEFPDLVIMAGTDYQLINCDEAGANGIISGLANVVPHLLYQGLAQPSSDLENGLLALRTVAKSAPKPAVLKTILNVLGLADCADTLPVLPVAPLPVSVAQTLLNDFNRQLEALEDRGIIPSLNAH